MDVDAAGLGSSDGVLSLSSEGDDAVGSSETL